MPSKSARTKQVRPISMNALHWVTVRDNAAMLGTATKLMGTATRVMGTATKMVLQPPRFEKSKDVQRLTRPDNPYAMNNSIPIYEADNKSSVNYCGLRGRNWVKKQITLLNET